MCSLGLVSIQSSSFFPRTGGKFWGFIQGILCAGKTRSHLPPFQLLIPQTTPKKHLLAVDSMNCLNKGCYPAEKDNPQVYESQLHLAECFLQSSSLPCLLGWCTCWLTRELRWNSLGKGGGWHRCNNKGTGHKNKKCVSAYIMNW